MSLIYLIENHPADSRVTLQNDLISQTLSARMGTGGGNVPMILNSPNVFDYQKIGIFGSKGVCSSLKVYNGCRDVVEDEYIPRRLTPLECIRLQGLPDWWCDGVTGTDSAVYKMAGNGIAIPCAYDIMNKIMEADLR